MYQGKIEAAPFDLFDVEAFDIKRCRKGIGLRVATQREVIAYARWLASKGGLYPYEDTAIGHRGVTFGERVKDSTWDREASRYTVAEYEPGSYSVPMPGANQRHTVTMETLDDSGEVIASTTLPVEPKKRGVIWDRAAVRKAAGPMPKPAKARKASPSRRGNVDATPPAVEIEAAAADFRPVEAQEPIEAVHVPSEPEIAPVASEAGEIATSEPAGDWLALVGAQEDVPAPSTETPEAKTDYGDLSTRLAAFVARLEAVEAACATLSHGDAHPGHENEQADAANVLPGPWKGARSLKEQRATFEAEQRHADQARRERIVRAYLRMRKERNSLRSHLSIGHAQYDDMKARKENMRLEADHAIAMRIKAENVRDAAKQRAESLEFDIADLRDQLAKQTARADAAEALAIPVIDKAQARIVELEQRLASLPAPKVPFKLAATMGRYVAPVAMGR